VVGELPAPRDPQSVERSLDAPLGRVIAIDVKNPARETWREIIPQATETLQSVSSVGGALFANYLKDASTLIKQYDKTGTFVRDVALPGIGSAGGFGGKETDTETFYSFTGFTVPSRIYRYDIASGKSTLFKQAQVDFNPDDYQTEQVFFTSKDGTKVPMFIISKKGIKRDGTNPTLLYAYGGFNVSLTPAFNPTIVPWLEKGGVYVVANLRGGGEYGEAWHRAGMQASKQNVFDDFYACAEWLIANKYTKSSRLAIEGGSNGGLLTGVASTQRPDLFAAAIVGVPLLDMLRYQDFLIARYWVPEYGSAEDKTQFETLRAYSPYHNIKKGTKYPALLVTAGENDSRVHPLHARKFVARLQAQAANDPKQDPIMLWVDRDAGHGQGKPLALRIRDEVDQWSFVMWQTGAFTRRD